MLRIRPGSWFVLVSNTMLKIPFQPRLHVFVLPISRYPGVQCVRDEGGCVLPLKLSLKNVLRGILDAFYRSSRHVREPQTYMKNTASVRVDIAQGELAS